ncbi:hypothetical protein K2173_028557 [Erythroxylum novogranatense]|uniref:Uncharacterized protein n=1 Tax=Erythroxylum novogranatense TaxID=1862640 RepID=A0AAV8U2E6_9ROSI|nr:hypothetical protein K2173_028557 [Erythroxylum novogranatense]
MESSENPPVSLEERDLLRRNNKKVKIDGGVSDEMEQDNSVVPETPLEPSRRKFSFKDVLNRDADMPDLPASTEVFFDDASDDDSDGDVDNDENDYDHVLKAGPWIVVGHYVTLQKWRPNFDPISDVIDHAVEACPSIISDVKNLGPGNNGEVGPGGSQPHVVVDEVASAEVLKNFGPWMVAKRPGRRQSRKSNPDHQRILGDKTINSVVHKTPVVSKLVDNSNKFATLLEEDTEGNIQAFEGQENIDPNRDPVVSTVKKNTKGKGLEGPKFTPNKPSKPGQQRFRGTRVHSSLSTPCFYSNREQIVNSPVLPANNSSSPILPPPGFIKSSQAAAMGTHTLVRGGTNMVNPETTILSDDLVILDPGDNRRFDPLAQNHSFKMEGVEFDYSMAAEVSQQFLRQDGVQEVPPHGQ